MSMNKENKKQIEGLSANEQFIDYILEKLLNEFNKLTKKMQIIIILFIIENIIVSVIFVTLYMLISGGVLQMWEIIKKILFPFSTVIKGIFKTEKNKKTKQGKRHE